MGKGGVKGNRHTVREVNVKVDPETGNTTTTTTWRDVIDNYPGKGTAGKNGASGFVVVYWDK